MACWVLLMGKEVFMHKYLLWCPSPLLFQESFHFVYSDETLFRILRSTSYWCFFFVYCMLRDMLTSFLLCFVRLQLTDFFHHLLLRVLQWLQHLNGNVSIVSGDPRMWLRFSPHSVGVFRLIRLLLVRCCWLRFCLRGHSAYVSCCSWFLGHLLARAFIFYTYLFPNSSLKSPI